MDRGQRGGYARAATAAALSGADILARGRGECIRSLLGRFTAAGLDLSLSRGLYTPAISYAPSGYCGFFLALSCCRRPLWFRRAVGSYISAPLCRPPLHIFRGETGRGLWRVFLRGDSGLYKSLHSRFRVYGARTAAFGRFNFAISLEERDSIRRRDALWLHVGRVLEFRVMECFMGKFFFSYILFYVGKQVGSSLLRLR